MLVGIPRPVAFTLATALPCSLPPNLFSMLYAWRMAEAQSASDGKFRPFGGGSKLNQLGTTGFSPWFHLPGFHFGYPFSTHSHLKCAACQDSIPRMSVWTEFYGRFRSIGLVGKTPQAIGSPRDGKSQDADGCEIRSHHEEKPWLKPLVCWYFR